MNFFSGIYEDILKITSNFVLIFKVNCAKIPVRTKQLIFKKSSRTEQCWAAQTPVVLSRTKTGKQIWELSIELGIADLNMHYKAK